MDTKDDNLRQPDAEAPVKGHQDARLGIGDKPDAAELELEVTSIASEDQILSTEDRLLALEGLQAEVRSIVEERGKPETRFKKAQAWVTFGLAVLGSILGLLGFIEGRRSDTANRRIEVTRLLDQAWDLLGGEPGTTTITVFVKNRHQRGLARRLVEEALRKDPDYPRAHRVRGVYLRSMGRLEQALESFRRAIELDPDYAAVHSNLGDVLRDQATMGVLPAVYPDYAVAHSNQGDLYPQTLVNLGTIFRDQGRLVEAEANYRRAIELDSDYAAMALDLDSASALYRVGNVAYCRERLDEEGREK